MPPDVPFGSDQQPEQPKSKRRWPWVVVAVVVAFGMGAAVGDGSGENADAATAASATTTVVVTETAPAPVAPTPEAAPVQVQSAPTPSVDTAPVVDFAMPALVGMDLQTAQNTVQTNGVFYSISHDLRGSRMQAVDSNWIVCTQNIAPGERVIGDVEGVINFGVVKREESCP
ncbi:MULTISPECIES: hypothetical protein [unclassified Modestobacter]